MYNTRCIFGDNGWITMFDYAGYTDVQLQCLAVSGDRAAEEELVNAQNAVEKLGVSLAERKSVVLREEKEISSRENLIFIKNEKTAPLYPRSNAQIKKKPL